MNIERFRQVLEMIEANPEHWNQDDYHCGTSHCFAGFCELAMLGLAATVTVATVQVSRKPFGWRGVSDEAKEFLDISELEADYLFSCIRTLEDFRAMVINGTILPPGWGALWHDEQIPF